jgi:hypothetical protein
MISMIRLLLLLLLLHGLAAIVPLLLPHSLPGHTTQAFGGWPHQFDSRPLLELGLSEQERLFIQGFPGRVGRFTDGSREIVLRWLNRPSRSLHPAQDCLKGVGYSVTPQPLRVDAEGHHWGCVRAERNGQTLMVCERVYDEANGSWSDVSSWYWMAMLGKSTGSWWAVTVAERAS